jgi:membrane protein YqaA with SNARE-associated domain
MAIIFVIIGAAAGGILGWLLGRKTAKEPVQVQGTCEPTSA